MILYAPIHMEALEFEELRVLSRPATGRGSESLSSVGSETVFNQTGNTRRVTIFSLK